MDKRKIIYYTALTAIVILIAIVLYLNKEYVIFTVAVFFIAIKVGIINIMRG